MKRYLLPVGLIILLIAAILLVSKNPTVPPLPQEGSEDPVTGIILERNTRQVVLQRVSGNIWEVAGPQQLQADQRKVNRLLQTIASFSFSDPVSEDPARYTYFQVDATAGITVTLKRQHTAPVSFIIGRINPGIQTTFVRVSGEPAVYQESGALPLLFAPQRQTWVQKAPEPVNFGTLTRVSIEAAKLGNQIIEKTPSGNWMKTSGSAADTQMHEMQLLLSSGVTEQQVPADSMQESDSSVAGTVTCEFTDKAPVQYHIVTERPDNTYIKVGTLPYRYRIHQKKIGPLLSLARDLLR